MTVAAAVDPTNVAGKVTAPHSPVTTIDSDPDNGLQIRNEDGRTTVPNHAR